VKEIDTYYKQCADEGATDDDVASKVLAELMEVILGDDGQRSLLGYYSALYQCL
jgi:hypothetical protein